MGNVGRDLGEAIRQARANARLTGHDRSVHLYNGFYWISFNPPKCHHWRVTPSGDVREVEAG